MVAAAGFRRAFAQAAAEAETAARVFEWKAVGDVCHVAFGQGGIAESERGALLYQRHIAPSGKQPLAHYAKRRGRSINR